MKDGKGAPEPEKKTVAAGPRGRAVARAARTRRSSSRSSRDFQCPFCARVEATVAEIKKTYGDKVKIVWRDKPLPMHPNAPLAAEAAREALKQKGPDGFWKMHDKLFESSSAARRLTREELEGYAKEIGLDMDKFKTALDSHAHKAAVDADDRKAGRDSASAARRRSSSNGYYMSGAQPFPKFKKLIDRALKDGAPKLGAVQDAKGADAKGAADGKARDCRPRARQGGRGAQRRHRDGALHGQARERDGVRQLAAARRAAPSSPSARGT